MARSLAQIPLPCPIAALRQHVIALGKTRAGKSSKLRVLVEALLEAMERVCIIDPKGDWWGLKSSADGSRVGFPVLILGGTHGDMPLPAHAGKEVGELVASGAAPAVLIDTSELGVGERERFMMAFLEALFRKMVGALNLVVDECHNFAPQGKVDSIEAGRMLRWSNRLASEGSGRGITLFSASQRPQKVHKDYLTSHETLIACRLVHPLDRGAVRDWMDGADPKLAKEIDASLAEMPRTEAWVWSPEIKYGPTRSLFPMFRTFDSFSPRADRAQVVTAPIDIAVVRDRLAAIVAEQQQNDPTTLKKRVVELEQLLRKETARANNEQARANKLDGIIAERNRALIDVAEPDDTRASFLQAAIEDAVRNLSVAIGGKVAKQKAPAPKFPKGPTASTGPFTPADFKPREPVGANTKPQQRILDALAFWEATGLPGPFSKPQVAFLAGYSPKSTSFTNPLGSLNSAGKVRYPSGGMIEFTEQGRSEANRVDAAPTNEVLQARILAQLSEPQRRILEPLLEEYPKYMTHEELARRANYSHTSTSFTNPRGSLRTLGLIQYNGGHVLAAPFLFLPGK